MTTEILRNILYRLTTAAALHPLSADERSSASAAQAAQRLGDVGLVVLDEVHWLGDRCDSPLPLLILKQVARLNYDFILCYHPSTRSSSQLPGLPTLIKKP